MKRPLHPEHIDRLLAVAGKFRVDPLRAENFDDHFRVDLIIFRKEDVLPVEHLILEGSCPVCLQLNLLLGRQLIRKIDRKLRSVSECTLTADRSSHQFDEILDNIQPQAGPVMVSAVRIFLNKRQEHPFLEGITHPDSIVLHHVSVVRTGALVPDRRAQKYRAALRCELQAV